MRLISGRKAQGVAIAARHEIPIEVRMPDRSEIIQLQNDLFRRQTQRAEYVVRRLAAGEHP